MSMIGQTVSHYRVVERLGGGGMGIVYKAIDTRLNRPVALKFLAAELTADRDANARFRQEAQAASALDHPNICTIYEIDETPSRELFLAMAYYDGETLKARLDRGPIPITEAIDIVTQVAQALSRTHESGIVHRDIKPANLMIARDGLVKILDFGLAKLAGPVSDLTRTGTVMGTVSYMSPEQISGEGIDARCDVWALGVVLFEILAGRRPFEGQTDLAVFSAIVSDTPAPVDTLGRDVPAPIKRILSRALDKHLTTRYRSATEMLSDLVAFRASTGQSTANVGMIRTLRRPLVALTAAVVLIGAATPAVMAYRRASRARWVSERLPEIRTLLANDEIVPAFSLARSIEGISPSDPGLVDLWPRLSAPASMETIPAGADVYYQPYAVKDDHWEYLGRTPLNSVRLPRAVIRFKVTKDGYEPTLLAASNPSSLLRNGVNRLARPLSIALQAAGSSSESVEVPGGSFPVALSAFSTDDSIALPPFQIDRYEVTNKAFKHFVVAGGYTRSEYWQALPFRPDERFHDSTDRPGPSTWEVGEYLSGRDDYPVSGVSWYEADAYCRSAGKRLPTLYHWTRAALAADEMFSPLAPVIIPASNFGSGGPAPVGKFQGMGPYGTFDMGGNVREWVWNETSGDRRWILGGSWNDPEWMLIQRNSAAPLDRSAANGFRCASYESAALATRVVAPIVLATRDVNTVPAVSDEVYRVFNRQLVYSKAPLKNRLEATDTDSKEWTREKISFDAAYENTRVTMYLFLPRNASPPFQLIVTFPGLSAFAGSGSSDKAVGLGLVGEAIIRTGRAVLSPVYKGSYERWDPFLSLQGEEGQRTWRQRMLEWRADLGRALDVAASRDDINIDRVAYLGTSFGASVALPLLAVEDRFKAVVLLSPGIGYRLVPPEADPINYVSHITKPVLMIGGRQDYVLSLEEQQKPLFDRLGTPLADRRHVVFDAGHVAGFPRAQTIRETLAWLDRYLGQPSVR